MQASQIGAIGIDLGSQRSVIAVAKKGGVEVLANEGSHRETQNIIGFGDKERFLGEQGALQMKSNFKNTVNFFNRFLGIQGRPPFFKDETRWLTVSNELGDNGKLLFNVQYQGQKHQLTPELLTATMLNKLKDIILKNGVNFTASNVVISVPTYYTEQERKALLDACRIAEIPVERLFNETTAIATSYGLFRKSDLDPEVARYVAFVDFGHSKTSAFVGSFTKEKVQIIAQVNDRNFGARDLDWGVYEHFCEIFEKESGGLTPKDSKKSQLRLLEAIEKQRKVLSANSEAHVNVEYLVEDVDFNNTLSREQYEKLIEPFLTRFSQLMEFLAVQVQNLKIKLHSVEIIGGATRMPIVQQIICSALQLDQVSKTLNASESIARGCAMMAAMKSPSYRVTEYQIEDANYYPIRVGWLYNSTLDAILKQQTGMDIEQTSLANFYPEKQKPVLFDNNCSIPSLKSFNLTKTDNIELTLFYDPAPPGFQSIIQQVRIPAVKPTHPEYHTKIRIRQNQNGLTQLEDAVLIEDYIEEVKVLKEQPKVTVKDTSKETKDTTEVPKDTTKNVAPQEQDGVDSKMQEEPQKDLPVAPEEFEIKKKKQTLQTILNCEASNYYTSSQKEISANFEVEATMTNQDNLTHETYKKKNELEAYIYSLKDQLQVKLRDYTTQTDTDKNIKDLDIQYEWLYNEGVHATKSQYAQRLEALKQQCDPILKRYNDYTQTPEAITEFLKIVKQAEQFALTTDVKYDHISQEERQKVTNEGQTAKQWSQTSMDKLSKKDRTSASEVTTKDVTKYQQEFIQKTQTIMNKPKPIPKVEPKVEQKVDPAQAQAAAPQDETQNQAEAPTTKMETEE